MFKSLEISILNSKKRSRSLSSLISSSNIHKETHVDSSWEAGAFSQNSEPIGEVSYVVFMWDIGCLNRFESFKWSAWIKSSNTVSMSSLVKSVEDFVENTWVSTEGSFVLSNKVVVDWSNSFGEHLYFIEY